MLATLKFDRTGCLIVTPVNQHKIRRELERTEDVDLFIQAQSTIEEAMSDFRATAEDWRWLDQGWDIRKRIDDETFFNYLAALGQ